MRPLFRPHGIFAHTVAVPTPIPLSLFHRHQHLHQHHLTRGAATWMPPHPAGGSAPNPHYRLALPAHHVAPKLWSSVCQVHQLFNGKICVLKHDRIFTLSITLIICVVKHDRIFTCFCYGIYFSCFCCDNCCCADSCNTFHNRMFVQSSYWIKLNNGDWLNLQTTRLSNNVSLRFPQLFAKFGSINLSNSMKFCSLCKKGIP